MGGTTVVRSERRPKGAWPITLAHRGRNVRPCGPARPEQRDRPTDARQRGNGTQGRDHRRTGPVAHRRQPLMGERSRALFTRNTTLDTIWRQAPSHHGHWSSFVSSRTRGAIGRTDPNHAGSGFYRSIVGWPSTSTSAVRLGLPRAPTPAPAPPTKPVPAPAPPPGNSGKTVRVTSIASLMANLAN